MWYQLHNLHANDEGIYTDYAGQNPDYGASLVYQPTPGKDPPTLQLLDHGRVIRTYTGNKEPSPFAPPPAAGATQNRGFPTVQVCKNSHMGHTPSTQPTKWNGAKFFKGPDEGASVPPGTYGYRMTVGGKTFTGSFVVKADPNTHYTRPT